MFADSGGGGGGFQFTVNQHSRRAANVTDRRIDFRRFQTDNSYMTAEVQSVFFTDMESVCASIADQRPLDPAIARRVQERAESLRRHLPETNVPVELIREVRDDE